MASKTKVNENSGIPDELRERMVAMTHENWDEFLATLKEIATGLWYEEIRTDKNDMPISIRVYQTKPDKDVLTYLTNQVIGKPKESMNIEGKVNLIMDA